MPELPPRARRIQNFPPSTKPAWGTTSACAENTRIDGAEILLHRNYLRVRGEYSNPSASRAGPPELPPRARRIPPLSAAPHHLCGTTSACAENTMLLPIKSVAPRNYLRVRGEYLEVKLINLAALELPPRARRIPPSKHPGGFCAGTTSACAENTRKPHHPEFSEWNYLRVRGEYSVGRY